jgi:hypothetical protein
MVEVRTIADGFLNYTKATAISLNGIRLLCYLGILCRVALTDHSTRKIPGRYHIYILLINNAAFQRPAPPAPAASQQQIWY